MPFTKEQILDRAVQRLSKKPLAEQSLSDLCELFAAAKDLTYVFVATSSAPADRVDEYGPDYLSAFELASCVSNEMEFRRPFPGEVDTCDDDKGLPDNRRRIQHELDARLRALRQRTDTSYLLLWCIEGIGETHCEHSPDQSFEDVLRNVIWLFSDLMVEYINI